MGLGNDGNGGGTHSSYMSPEERENLDFVEQEYRIAHSNDIDPSELSLNMSKWQVYPWGIRALLEGADYYETLYEDGYNGVIIDNVEVSPGSVTVTVHEDAAWSNGDQITGKHVRNHVLRSIFMRVSSPRNEVQSPSEVGAPMLLVRSPTDDGGDWRQDAIEVDGKSVTFKTKEGWYGEQCPWTEDTLKREFYGAVPEMPVYNQIFEDFMSLEDPFGENFSEVESLRSQYRNMDVGWEDVATCGPFYLSEVNQREYTLEKNEGYPYADRINWPTIKAEYIEGAQSKRTALVEGHLDASGSVSMPERTLSALPEEMVEFRHEVPSGASFNVHIGDGNFSDVRARQAIQHVIDRQAITEAVSGETVIEASPIEIPGAMGGIDEILSDEFLSSLNKYEPDQERATQLLEDAGFSKEGGTWMTPDGNEWSFRIQTDASVPHMETLMVNQLQSFGIQAELYTQDSAVLQQNKESGSYDMAPGSWGGEAHSALAFFWWIPQNPVQRGIHGIWTDEQVQQWGEEVEPVNIDENGYAHNFQAEHLKDYFTIEAPPVGEPDGELQEYDTAWAAMMLDWGYRLEDRSYEELLEELAWIYNWYVPEFPIHKQKAQKFHNTSKWIVPPEDQEKKWYRGPKSLINSGHISAKPE
ncbi:ABC transporter substrate-binding protein [Natronoarchaeum philippinense]|nr:ABC transporter substrate-binding protein [Natronoarchaeum philippinense]